MRILLWSLIILSVFSCSNPDEATCKLKADGTDNCRYLNHCSEGGCCKHKDLMPLKGPEIAGTILIFVLSGMSNAGGIGGGPIMTTFEMLLFYFTPKQSIPLSQTIIAAGGFISLIIRGFWRHPTRNRPLLDYHLCMLIVPPILLGSTFGVIVNAVLPNIAILILLTLLLVFMTALTLKNGVVMYISESQQRKRTFNAELSASESQLINASTHGDTTADTGPKPDSLANSLAFGVKSNAEPQQEELARIYTRESKQIPLIPSVWIAAVTVYTALGLLIRGSKGKSFAGIRFCSEGFQAFFGLWSAGLLILTFLPMAYLLRLKKTYDRLGYDYDEFDVKWTNKKCVHVYLAGLLSGFGGGMLGFGASLLVAPILVQWKVRSQVIGPTAALMTVIGSAVSVLQFAESKELIGDYAGWLAMTAFLGALTGVLVITKIMKCLGRNSPLVLVLAVVLGIAMVLVPVYTIIGFVKDSSNEFGLKPYCK